MNKKIEVLLKKYAKLAIQTGVNIQKGQRLLVNCPVELAYFAREISKVAYETGAKEVKVEYSDEQLTLDNYLFMSEDDLKEYPQWKKLKQEYLIDKNYAFLSIHAATPGLLKDIDPNKLQSVAVALSKHNKKLQEYIMGNNTQWSIVSLPTEAWALKVFPELKSQEAMEKLLEAILHTARVDEKTDPIENWSQHNNEMTAHNKILNDFNFEYLTFKNKLGTDLKVYLADNHNWAGGCEKTTKGVVFNPNIPTEENFCMPYKTKVYGKVVATKPLNYQGRLIEDFYLEFDEGKVIKYHAAKELQALKNLIEFDEGSCYLGEVALISYDSPINDTGILFYNTLFDENASCHLALGNAYPMNIKGGTTMAEDDLKKLGYNSSMAHVDFMFGSRDMVIKGYDHNGKEVVIFNDGNFVI
ncbi:MAG: aminopeptidase [Erysipelotrichaceae bacterium]